MPNIRLDKYLANMGVGSRTAVKELIRKKQVTVNEVTAVSPEQKVDTERDRIFCQGEPIGFTEFEYLMLHKPAGVVSAVTDDRDRTVIDLIDARKRKDLFPVGRLDKDTEGLLLITNDGKLANQLLNPRKHVDKTYYARVRGAVTTAEQECFREGLDIGDDTLTKPAELEILSSGPESEILLTITEGRFHQVKRMFQAVGMEILYLKRLSMGPLRLDESLPAGAWRPLTVDEIRALHERR